MKRKITKILCVFGTRPEAIKLAPVIRELSKHPDRFEACVCVTAQHRELLDHALDLNGIQPDIDLDLMREGQTLSGVASKVLAAVTEVLKQEQPDIVLIQGDTTTAMATALAAFHLRTPVAHVEAGLRTKNRYEPFPRRSTGGSLAWRRLTTSPQPNGRGRISFPRALIPIASTSRGTRSSTPLNGSWIPRCR